MNALLRNWIAKRIAMGAFSRRRDVLRFAVVRTIWTTLAAIMLSQVVNYSLSSFRVAGLAPLNPAGDALITVFVAGPISFLAYCLIGKALCDLAISRNEFERLSRTDPLTGLMNRRAFVDAFPALDRPFVVAILDIDRFKSINDTYGHAAGDAVLVEIAHELERILGGNAVIARLGGEEFGIILKDRDRFQTMALMELLRATLANRTFDAAGHEIRVTFSGGLAAGDGRTGYSNLLTHADRALYLAKAAGRNRIIDADDALVVLPALGNRGELIAV